MFACPEMDRTFGEDIGREFGEDICRKIGEGIDRKFGEGILLVISALSVRGWAKMTTLAQITH